MQRIALPSLKVVSLIDILAMRKENSVSFPPRWLSLFLFLSLADSKKKIYIYIYVCMIYAQLYTDVCIYACVYIYTCI